MTEPRGGLSLPHPPTPKKFLKKKIVEVFEIFKEHTYFWPPQAPQTSIWAETSKGQHKPYMLLAPSPPLFYISLSLSFSDFLIYHFQPRHCLVGLLFIFSSFLPLRLDCQLFMMFHYLRDFTLQI